MMPGERITALETWRDGFVEGHRAERAQQEKIKTDVEARLRRLEKAMYLGMGGLALLQLILKYAH